MQIRSKWQKRYFVLADGVLYYYKKQKDKAPGTMVPALCVFQFLLIG